MSSCPFLLPRPFPPSYPIKKFSWLTFFQMNFSEKSRSPKQTYVPGGNEDSGSDDDDDVDFSEVGDTSLTAII